MRTPDLALRKLYVDTASAVRRKGTSVTTKSLALATGKTWNSVRKYFDQHPDLIERLGVEIKFHTSEDEYLEAAKIILERNKKITHAALAEELELDRSNITKFLADRIDLRLAIEELPQPEPPLKNGQELYVSYFHEGSGRMVSGGVSLREYVRLWDKKLLKFQLPETRSRRPLHLPSRAEALKYV